MRIETIVFSEEESSAPFLKTRTLRALGRLGQDARLVDASRLETALVRARGPVWLLRAGAVPSQLPRFLPSATGQPLLALGATRGDPRWRSLVTTTGGDLRGARHSGLPDTHCVLLERPSALAGALHETSFDEAVARVASSSRVLVLPQLEVGWGARLRVLVVVTTLHRGGAERVAVELARGLGAHDVDAHLAVLDSPRRETLRAPRHDKLFERANDRAGRLRELLALHDAIDADVVSAHLLDGTEIDALRAHGACVAVVLHNAREGWQEGSDKARANAFIACSRRVARDAAVAEVRAPVRVAFNGVVGRRTVGREETRASLGIGAHALVIVAVANPRAQKRLEKAVGVTAALVLRGRDAHLVLVGAPLGENADASRLVDETSRARAMTDRVHRVGSTDDVGPWLAAADVMLSTSAWEGMSLAQLEALGAGLPVVATDVGGADEVARAHPGRYVRVAVDASDEAFATAILSVSRRRSNEGVARAFTSSAMVARHAALLDRIARSPAHQRGPVWLVTNNLSTGGAQSSARRLLMGLRDRGQDVRAVVLQEQHEHPTLGRAALERAGVRVMVAPRAEENDAAVSVAAILEAVDREGSSSVLFWNAIPEHKVLLADALVGARVFDVSPGEMFFASLDRYFRGPRAESPVLDARDYGALLTGVVVKYGAEAARARDVLGAPVTVIPNGVDSTATLRRRRDTLTLGTLARLSPDKRLEQLVAATRVALAHGAPPFEVLVAGEVETGCEAWAKELVASCEGLPIRFVGHRDAADLLAELDVFAMISEPMGCPNASLEAMAAGLPIVATDVGGVSEQLEEGAGVLVPRGDSEAMGRAIASILADPKRREALGAQAKARANERFSLDRMVSDYAKLLGVNLS